VTGSVEVAEAARPATPADTQAVIDLAHQAITELAPHRGGAVWEQREARRRPADDALEAVIAGQVADALAVVGTVDDVVVGYGVVTVEPLHDEARLAVVTDLYVDPEARAIGIGEAMMDLLVEHARSAGAVGIDALALPGDRQTKNFFETFGLTARAIIVHRSLRDAPATDASAPAAASAPAPAPAPAPVGDVVAPPEPSPATGSGA
jgi:ribosomal protein S18 acetylase RimI-like enzyme